MSKAEKCISDLADFLKKKLERAKKELKEEPINTNIVYKTIRETQVQAYEELITYIELLKIVNERYERLEK